MVKSDIYTTFPLILVKKHHLAISCEMNIVELGCRCGTWKVEKPQSAKKLIFSLKFDQFDPFPQMTQIVCQKSAV